MAVCESLERALKESISYVLERFDGVEKLSDEQTSGVLNFIQRKDVLAVLPTGSGKSLLFQLIPGLCLRLNQMGYCNYPHSNKFSIYRDLKDDNSFSVTSKRSMRRKHFLQRTRGPIDRFSSTPNNEEILEQILNFSAVSDVRL